MIQKTIMQRTAYILAAIAALITVVIGLDSMSTPYSTAALGFILWAASPYGLLALIIKVAKSKPAITLAFILCLLAIVFGLGLIIDAMYIHLDAQGALIFIFGPLWQWVGLLISLVPVLLLNQRGT